MTTKDFDTKLVEAGISIGDFAKWPDKASTIEAAQSALKDLSKAIKDENYTSRVLDGIVMQLANNMLDEARRRDVKTQGLRSAWNMLAELLR